MYFTAGLYPDRSILEQVYIWGKALFRRYKTILKINSYMKPFQKKISFFPMKTCYKTTFEQEKSITKITFVRDKYITTNFSVKKTCFSY